MNHHILYSSKELHRYYIQYALDSIVTVRKLQAIGASIDQINKWEAFYERAICLVDLWEKINRRNGYASGK